jgi:hypothetical protein
LGIFDSRQIIFIKAGHHHGTYYNRKLDMETIIFFENVLTKKGVENFSFPMVSIEA